MKIFKRKIRTHNNENDVLAIYAMLTQLFGPCLGINFFHIKQKQYSKCINIYDVILKSDFNICYFTGSQSFIIDNLKRYKFITDGSETIGGGIREAILSLTDLINKYAKSFIIIGQLPRGVGLQLIKRGTCNESSHYLIPPHNLISNIIIEDGVRFHKVSSYEVYIVGRDSMYITFIYFRSLTVLPQPQQQHSLLAITNEDTRKRTIDEEYSEGSTS